MACQYGFPDDIDVIWHLSHIRPQRPRADVVVTDGLLLRLHKQSQHIKTNVAPLIR